LSLDTSGRIPRSVLYNSELEGDLWKAAILDIGERALPGQTFRTLPLSSLKTVQLRSAQPTPTHYFFRLLDQHSLLKRVFTQNIDTLETLAGLDESRIIEAHGSFATAHCLECRKEASKEYVLRWGGRKGEVVRCDECDGLVKPDIVFFGEGLPDRFFQSLQVSDGLILTKPRIGLESRLTFRRT
jgi:NAD-dependent SIR2 family protein deacetylase